MKIIEGMKQLRLIEKKIKTNLDRIEQYSSGLSSEKELFGNEEGQKKEVSSLIASNIQLATNYADLKSSLENTNLQTRVKIDNLELTISEWLTMRRKTGTLIMSTFRALSSRTADSRLTSITRNFDKSELPKVVRYFDEAWKNEQLNMWMGRIHNIDATLEVINATTDMI